MEAVGRGSSFYLKRLGLGVLALALGVALGGLSVARAEDSGHETPAQRVESTVNELKTKLTLSPEQETQLRAIYLEYYEKTAALRSAQGDKSSEAREKYRQERDKLRQDLEAKLATVLTPAQMAQYKQYKETQHGEMRKKWGSHGEGKEKEGGEKESGEKESSE